MRIEDIEMQGEHDATGALWIDVTRLAEDLGATVHRVRTILHEHGVELIGIEQVWARHPFPRLFFALRPEDVRAELRAELAAFQARYAVLVMPPRSIAEA